MCNAGHRGRRQSTTLVPVDGGCHVKQVSRVVLVLAIVAIGAWLLGFWSPADVLGGRWGTATVTTGPVDSEAIRQRMDRLDEGAGRAVQKADAYVEAAALSGKIKSKMALDDMVRARTIGVSTTNGVVTLEGTVRSVAERDQAVRLARDTNGVTRVIDHLIVQL